MGWASLRRWVRAVREAEPFARVRIDCGRTPARGCGSCSDGTGRLRALRGWRAAHGDSSIHEAPALDGAVEQQTRLALHDGVACQGGNILSE
jgi:hypothetical protein